MCPRDKGDGAEGSFGCEVGSSVDAYARAGADQEEGESWHFVQELRIHNFGKNVEQKAEDRMVRVNESRLETPICILCSVRK